MVELSQSVMLEGASKHAERRSVTNANARKRGISPVSINYSLSRCFHELGLGLDVVSVRYRIVTRQAARPTDVRSEVYIFRAAHVCSKDQHADVMTPLDEGLLLNHIHGKD